MKKWKTWLLIKLIGLLLLAFAARFLVSTCTAQTSYQTSFPLTENPISQGGIWLNGQTNGLEWSNCRTITGMAFGCEPANQNYIDGTAILTGTWSPTQSAAGTVKVVAQPSGTYEEVELRLRSSISANVCSGYEINGSVSATYQYITITRWNGPLGSFTQLAITDTVPTLTTGDVLSATAVGSVITAYLNGTQVLQVTDNTFPDGNPGMGFDTTSGNDSAYGFSSYTATGLLSATPTPTPIPSATPAPSATPIPTPAPTSTPSPTPVPTTTPSPSSTPSQVPVLLSATPGNKSVTLQWSESYSASAVWYEVNYGTVNGGPYSGTAGTSGATSVTVGGLNAGTTFYFVVTGYVSPGTSDNLGTSNQMAAVPTGSNRRP